MPKKTKKAIKKKLARQTKKAKAVKKAKPTLVWKRAKRGRPKKALAKKTVVPTFRSGNNKPGLKAGTTLEPTHQNTELAIEQSKFQIGPRQNAGEFQAHNLPFEYGHNRIVMLVVDPKFIFVYWEVRQDKMHEAIEKIGFDAKLALKFYNIETAHAWDVPIYERVGSWYLRLDHPEQNLYVEIGMKNGRGDFYSLARSGSWRLPRLGLAAPGPIKWMLVSPTGERVITEIEEYTDADLELLKKILGPYFFDLLRRGRFAGLAGGSVENVFTEISGIMPPGVSS